MRKIFLRGSETLDDKVMEFEDGSVEFETPTDDEEVKIPSQNKYKKVPDMPISDIRDEQTLLNTQREDWLLPTESMHGARLRQTGRERPPVTFHGIQIPREYVIINIRPVPLGHIGM